MMYWKLIKWDGEEIKVKPGNVKFVQDKLDTKEGFIRTLTRSIAVKDIKDFVQTSEVYTDQKLIEGGSQAFKYVMENEDGSVQYRWVKKNVTKRDYTKYYAAIPAYRKLEDNDSFVVVSWKQPVHLIDFHKMSELTPTEELNFSKKSV